MALAGTAVEESQEKVGQNELEVIEGPGESQESLDS